MTWDCSPMRRVKTITECFTTGKNDMSGCELDTDGDGNCPKHPNGCADALWAENFKGKCITCAWARSSFRTRSVPLKNQMTCNNAKAITRGLGARGWGGGSPAMQVHKLFGCIYWRQE